VHGSGWLAKIRSSLTKQSCSRINIFEAFEHIEDILNVAFMHVWYSHTHILWQSCVCDVWLPRVESLWFRMTSLNRLLVLQARALTYFTEIPWLVRRDEEFCENPILFCRVINMCSGVYFFSQTLRTYKMPSARSYIWSVINITNVNWLELSFHWTTLFTIYIFSNCVNKIATILKYNINKLVCSLQMVIYTYKNAIKTPTSL